MPIVAKWRPTVLRPGQDPAGYGAKAVQLYPEAATRRLWAFGDDRWLAVYDLDALTPLGGGVLTTFAGTPTAFFTDAPTGALMVGYLGSDGRTWIDEYNLVNGAVARTRTVDLTAALGGKRVSGMYRAPRTNVVWVLADVVAAGTVTIAELALPTDPAAPAQVHWVQPVENCVSPVHFNTAVPAAIGFVPKNNALYFGCGNPLVLEAYAPPAPRGVGRLSLNGFPSEGRTAAGEFTLFARAGDFAKGDSWFDPVSGRFMMVAYTNAAGASVYVFDTLHERYVGGIAAGKNVLSAVGFHATGGRFYALSASDQFGMVMGDVRLTPPGQGTTVPYLARQGGVVPITNSNLAVDPKTSRLFLRYGEANDFVIVQDRVPFAAIAPEGDPDSQTLDVAEVPGVTSRTISGNAQGYGARYRQIGGTQALLLNYGLIDPGVHAVGAGTREFKSAYLHRLTLASDEATAAAISADRDLSSTQSDLDRTQPKDNNGDPIKIPDGDDDPSNDKIVGPIANWPFEYARCADFGEKANEQTVTGAAGSCDAARHLVTASAHSTDVVSGVSVQHASVEGRSFLDEKRGTVTRVVSTARNVTLLDGVLRMGEVTAEAEVWARGRPGTTGTRYTPTLRDVILQGERLCTDDCDPQRVADQVNTRLSGRVRMTVGGAEQRATDGGYEAVVRRSPIDHIEQIVVNEQPADRLEVPVLTLTYVQDAGKPQRNIVELAGVEAEARYGISGALNAGEDGPSGPGDNELASGSGATTPIFGLTDVPRAPGGIGDTGDGLGSQRRRVPSLTTTGKLIWNGLTSLALLPIWAVLLMPIYLSARRWLLLQRADLVAGGRR